MRDFHDHRYAVGHRTILTLVLSFGLAGCGETAESVQISGDKSSKAGADASPSTADAGSSPPEGGFVTNRSDTGTSSSSTHEGDTSRGADGSRSETTMDVGAPDTSTASGPPSPPESMYAVESAGGEASSSNFEARIRIAPHRSRRTSSPNYELSLQPPAPID